MPLAPVICAGARARGPSTGSFSKQAVTPIGIPDMSEYGKPHEGLDAGKIVKFVLQHHQTARQPDRPHFDLRLGTPETGLYSWAVPKAQMPEPGEKRLAPQTQVHAYGYGDFTGRIGKGYGAGNVTMADNGKALITKVTPNSISFTLAHARIPRRYTLIKIPQEKVQGNKPQWLLLGVAAGKSKVPGVGDKPSYQMVKADTLDDAMEQASQVQAKLDGAHAVYDINESGKLEAYSVNPRVTGEPVVHTERLGLHHTTLPKLRNSTFRGEIVGTDPAGKAISFNELSGLLNANLAKSLEDQQARGVSLRNAPFGVIRYKGKPFEGGPDEQRALLEAIIKQFPKDRFQLPEVARTPEEKQLLRERIETGQYPMTREGLILHVGDKRLKYKLRPEKTLYLRGTYAGEGKRRDTAGGLLAGTSKDAPGNVRLGTGFTDEQLADIVANLPTYLNRPVRVEHQGEFGNGLLRAPSFKGFETDKSAGLKKIAQLARRLFHTAEKTVDRGVFKPDSAMVMSGHGHADFHDPINTLGTVGSYGYSAADMGELAAKGVQQGAKAVSALQRVGGTAASGARAAAVAGRAGGAASFLGKRVMPAAWVASNVADAGGMLFKDHEGHMSMNVGKNVAENSQAAAEHLQHMGPYARAAEGALKPFTAIGAFGSAATGAAKAMGEEHDSHQRLIDWQNNMRNIRWQAQDPQGFRMNQVQAPGAAVQTSAPTATSFQAPAGFGQREAGRMTIGLTPKYPLVPGAPLSKESMEKLAKITRRGKKWVLHTRDGKHVLGTHKSRTAALRQERAILMHKRATDHPLAAILAGMGIPLIAQGLAHAHMHDQLEKTPILPAENVPAVLKAVEGIDPQLVVRQWPGFANAAYVQPGSEVEKGELSALLSQDMRERERAKRHGLIVYDPEFLRAGILAHEGGHARIENKGGFSRFNQRYLRPIGSALSIPASMAAMHMSSTMGAGPLLTAGLVGGANTLFNLPQLINEMQATRYANRYLDESSHHTRTKEQNRRALRSALLTYLTAGTLGPMIAGGAYAALRGRDKTAEQLQGIAKSGQWTMSPYTGAAQQFAGTPRDNALQNQRNAFWSQHVYRRPEDPPSYRDLERKEPKREHYLTVTTPGGKLVRVNVSMLGRGLGLSPDADPNGTYILPERTRLKLQRLLAKTNRLSKAVEQLPSSFESRDPSIAAATRALQVATGQTA